MLPLFAYKILNTALFAAILGGAMGMGNTNPVAEFNIEVDPEAAAIVFNAEIRELVMVPLEVSHTVLVTEDILQEFRRLEVRSSFPETCYGMYRTNSDMVLSAERVR